MSVLWAVIRQPSCGLLSGCADGVCRESGAAKLPGEDNARRWIVYAVPAEFIKKPAARKTGKGKSKKSRPPKSEL